MMIISRVSARAAPVGGRSSGRMSEESVAGRLGGRGVVTRSSLRREKGSQVNDGGS